MPLRVLPLAGLLVLLAPTASRAQQSSHFLPPEWPAHQWAYVGPWQLTVWRERGEPAGQYTVPVAPDSLEFATSDLQVVTCRTCLGIPLPEVLWDSLHLRRPLATTLAFEVTPGGHLHGQAPGRQVYSAGALDFEGYWDGDTVQGFWYEFRPRHHRFGRFVLVPQGPRPPAPVAPPPNWTGAPLVLFAPTDANFRALADSLARLDPRVQLEVALGRGDRRLLALQTGLPGIQVDHAAEVRAQLGVLLLPWTGEFRSSPAQKRWQQVAGSYARRYNRLVAVAVGMR